MLKDGRHNFANGSTRKTTFNKLNEEKDLEARWGEIKRCKSGGKLDVRLEKDTWRTKEHAKVFCELRVEQLVAVW